MPSSRANRTTQLLSNLVRGDRGAAEEVLPLVYDELHELAGSFMLRQGGDHTLQPTALVNEAWLRLVDRSVTDFESRKQFFALAARAMRSVLVDHARASAAQKRGGDRRRLTLLDADGGSDGPDLDVLSLQEALERLEERDPELGRIVELRFFAGLTNQEVADVTGTPLRTTEHRWRLARAWLHGELSR